AFRQASIAALRLSFITALPPPSRKSVALSNSFWRSTSIAASLPINPTIGNPSRVGLVADLDNAPRQVIDDNITAVLRAIHRGGVGPATALIGRGSYRWLIDRVSHLLLGPPSGGELRRDLVIYLDSCSTL